MPSVDETIQKLLAELTADKDKELRYRHAALFREESGQALIILQEKDPVNFEATLGEIHRITGLSLRSISRHIENVKTSRPEESKQNWKPSDEDIRAARLILYCNPIQAHVDYVTKVKKVHGGEKASRVITMSTYSSFLPVDNRLHTDVAGSSQNGKSTVVTAELETFPEENILVLSEASPRSLYYFAGKNPDALKDITLYLDDEREEHIPVLKTFRNEGNVTPANLTVGDDKESLLQRVPHRPVIIGSSVNPLRDHEQQVGSRAFLVSIPDATPEEEKLVRKAIRATKRTGAILSKNSNAQRNILRAVAWTLREYGVRDILVPFDAEEPDSADRRGTGQFMKLILISAFINQFKRPILELVDGRKFVLAIYEDLELAATVWFDFAGGQEFKISPKAIDVLKKLPTAYPGVTAPNLANGKSQRNIERYLGDLFEAGLVNRQQLSAPGSPWGYWCDGQTRQKIVSQISETGDVTLDYDTTATNLSCRKYMAEKSSDSLKDSIKEFFSNNDIINEKEYKGIKSGLEGDLQTGSAEEIYLSHFSSNSCRESENASTLPESLRHEDSSRLSQMPEDIDSSCVEREPEGDKTETGQDGFSLVITCGSDCAPLVSAQ